MLEQNHLEEWLSSNVDVDLTNINVISLEVREPYDYLLYSEAISRRNDGRLRDRDLKKYQHLEYGGWWCSGIDPLNEYELMMWGCFKPNKPRKDIGDKKKVIKYEHPYKEPTRALFLRVTYRVGLAIAVKADQEVEYKDRVLQTYIESRQLSIGFRVPEELPTSFKDIPQEWLRTEDQGFWKWVKENNIPITLTEGAKKAGALLSAGYAAIALPGFNSLYRNRRDEYGNSIGSPHLIPDISHFATPGRSVTICFDYETKPQTINNINAAYGQAGRLLSKAGSLARIALLPGPDKGVDDFIVAKGVAAFDQIYLQSLTLDQWQVELYSNLTYTPNLTVCQRYLSEIPIVEGAKLIGVKSPKGTGKTFCLSPIVAQAIRNGQPVLIITHRVQLGQALAAYLGISYITEVRDDETGKLLGYALCVDSLHPNSQARFNASGWANALVIIDEVEQVTWHTLSAGTEVKKNRVEVIRQFSQLLHNVLTSERGRVIVCDADLTDLSFQFILGVAGVDIEPWILVNDWKPEDLSLCYHYRQTTPVTWFASLEDNIRNGDKPLILTQSQKAKSQWSTVNIESRLSKEFPEAKILRIDSETASSPTHPAYGCIGNNLNEILLQYDIAIASPVIETGVSIDIVEHFTSVWGCFHGVAPENSARQSLARLREDVPRHLWIASRGLGQIGNGAINVKSLLVGEHQKLKANLRLLQDASLTLDEDEIHVSQAAINVFGKMACRVNAGMMDYRGTVLRNLKGEGYKIIEVDVPEDADPKQLLESLKELKTANYNTQCQGIANADISSMTQAQFETLQQQKAKTPTERAQVRKYSLEQRYQVDVTPELVARDDAGWHPQLRLHYFLTIGKPHLPKRDARTAEAMINQGQLWMPDFNKGQLGSVVATLEILGIDKLISENTPLRASDESVQKLTEFVLNNRFGMKSILGLQFRPDSKPIVVLRRVVDKLGLKLKYIGRDGSGVRERIYQIVGQDDGRDMIFAAWSHQDESASTSGNNIKPLLEVDGTPNGEIGEIAEKIPAASSWWDGVKDYRRKAEGRRQKAEGKKVLKCPLPKGFKAPKFIYVKQKKMYFETRSAHIYGVLFKAPKFIYGDSFSIAAFVLLPSYVQANMKCFESGVSAVLEALKDLDMEQRWGVMLAVDEEYPSTFAKLIEAFPNWVEWCNC